MKAIIDYRTQPEAVKTLESLGCDIIRTIPVKSVYPEIDGHPDIQLHVINGKVICAPEVYDYYRERFDACEAVCGSARLDKKYPSDIAYNVCSIGNYAVCSRAHTAPEIIDEYEANRYTVLNTKQGYAKCSICVVSDNAAITADSGIYRLLSDAGVDVLKISSGNIELYGMDGFIGGCSGLIKHGLLTFNGDIYSHPDGKNIAEFCRKHNTEIVLLHTGRLTDIGSILVV